MNKTIKSKNKLCQAKSLQIASNTSKKDIGISLKPTKSSILRRTGHYFVQLFGRTSSLILRGGSAANIVNKKKATEKSGKAAVTQKKPREYKQPYAQAQYDQIASDASWHYEEEATRLTRRRMAPSGGSKSYCATSSYCSAASSTSSRRPVRNSESAKLRNCVERMLQCDDRPTMVCGAYHRSARTSDAGRNPPATSVDCIYKRNDEVGESPIYPIGEDSM